MIPRMALQRVLRPMAASRRYCSSTIIPSFAKEQDQSSETSKSFATLLRNSTFVQMGNPEGKVVIGEVYHVVDDDLYIDFGGKFHCVCARPRGPGGKNYTKGTQVKLKIKKLELSQKFLGYDKELSLLEADCILLGVHKS